MTACVLRHVTVCYGSCDGVCPASCDCGGRPGEAPLVGGERGRSEEGRGSGGCFHDLKPAQSGVLWEIMQGAKDFLQLFSHLEINAEQEHLGRLRAGLTVTKRFFTDVRIDCNASLV